MALECVSLNQQAATPPPFPELFFVHDLSGMLDALWPVLTKEVYTIFPPSVAFSPSFSLVYYSVLLGIDLHDIDGNEHGDGQIRTLCSD